jgi:formylglycine-generating enzyme required for sulfatase activity
VSWRALDTFVREYNPRIPPEQLSLDPATLVIQVGKRRQAAATTMTLINAGPGASYGSVQSSAPWLRADPQSYALPPGERLELQINVDAKGTPSGAPSAQIVVTPQAGQAIDAQVTIARPTAARATPQALATPAATQAAPTPGRSLTRLLPLVLLVLAIGGGVVAAIMIWPQGGNVEQGVLALQAGDWAQGIPQLERLSPDDSARVRQVAALLDGMMVPVPGGTFMMGSDSGAPDQRPAQEVPVGPLAVDRFEVTNAQYQRFVEETGHAAPTGWTGARFANGRAMHPVTQVTWEDAVAYAAWLGKRLPSEAEWEYAARGPEGRLYPWGDEPDAQRANVLGNLGPGEGGDTMVVGSHPQDATPLGILDLAGNVREWTADRYALYHVPLNPPSEGNRIAVRGASWNTYHDTATSRGWEEGAAPDLGFRCVK